MPPSAKSDSTSAALHDEREGVVFERPAIRLTASGRMDSAGAAQYLGLSERKLRQMRERDEGPCYSMIGRRVWYSLGDLDAYLSACRHVTRR
jgi:hypothetical protein